MNIGVAVVGHPKRKEMAEKLAKELGAELFLDTEGLGEWKNHARAWKSLREYDFGVVVQDDAVPIENCRQHMEAAIRARPIDVISFYTGIGSPSYVMPRLKTFTDMARDQKLSWLTSKVIIWGVAIGMPSGMIDPVVDSWDDDDELLYDGHIGAWCDKNRIKVSYTYPSLVDHSDVDTVAHDYQTPIRRVAVCVGPQRDPNDPRELCFW